MNGKAIVAAPIVLAVAIGGWWLVARGATPSLRGLPTAEVSTITASAVLDPEQPRPGERTTLTFSFTNPDGTPASDLMTHHARRVHVLVVGEDLRSVAHVHPQDFGEVTDEVVRSGQYSIIHTFPKAGRYIVGVDVMSPKGELGKQFIVNVKGSPRMGEPKKDLRREKCFKGYPETGDDRYTETVFTTEAEVACPRGYKITMTPSVKAIRAGEEVQLTYRVEKDGRAVADLEPYLDAAIHLAIVPSSFDTLLHRHGNPKAMSHRAQHNMPMEEGKRTEGQHLGKAGDEAAKPSQHGPEPMKDSMGMKGMHHGVVPASFGPDLVSEPITFSKAGLHQVFAQVKHEGKIIFSNFMIEVAAGR